MKKSIFLIALISLLSLFNACSAGYVSTQPVYVEQVRPNRPSQNHTWIEARWTWNSGTHGYIHHQGYWKHNKKNHNYSPGYWNNSPRGYKWVNGKKVRK